MPLLGPSVRPSVRPKCSGANGHLEINVWQAAPGRCLPCPVSWSDGARGRLDEMSSVWEEEGRERNWRGRRPSPPPPSLQSDSWNAPDIKWFVQSHIGGRGRGRRRWRPSEEEVYQGTHLVGIIASGSLPFLCRSVFVRAPSLHSRRSWQGRGRERRCLSSGTYSTCMALQGIPCCS